MSLPARVSRIQYYLLHPVCLLLKKEPEMQLRPGQVKNVNLSLNTLRTLSAFLVVIGHMRALFFVDFSESESKSLISLVFYAITSLGHQAVIVFFVLSGYWVGGAALRAVSTGTFTWLSYGTARLSRLWLVLIPAVALTQGLDRLGLFMNGSSSVYTGSASYHSVVPLDGPLPSLGWLDTLGNILFLQSIHVPPLGSNTPLWSLAYEFWYYVLFPALLLAVSRRTGRKARAAAVFVVLFGVVVAGPSVLALFPVWMAGAAIAWQRGRIGDFLMRLTGIRRVSLRLLALFSLIAACGLSNFQGPSYTMDFAVTLGAVVVVGVYSTDVSHSTGTLRPFSNAAEWSYTLYAVHLPIIAFVASFLVPSADQRWQLSVTSVGLALAVVSGLSAFCWAFALATEGQTAAVRRRVLSVMGARRSSLEVGIGPDARLGTRDG